MAHKMHDPRLSTVRDARAIRTRSALRRALLNLLETQPLEQITIRDITAAAEIGYASFFRHHPTKEALLNDIVEEQIANLISMAFAKLETGTTKDATLALIRSVDGQRELWTTLLTGGAASIVRDHFVRVISSLSAGLSRPTQRYPTDIAVILASTGTVEILAWWLRQKDSLPIEKAAEIFNHFIVSPLMLNDETEAWRETPAKKKAQKKKGSK